MGNDISVLIQRIINIIDYKAKINGAEGYDKAETAKKLKLNVEDIVWENFEDTFDHRLTAVDAADVSIFAQIEKLGDGPKNQDVLAQLMDVVMSNDTILDLINVIETEGKTAEEIEADKNDISAEELKNFFTTVAGEDGELTTEDFEQLLNDNNVDLTQELGEVEKAYQAMQPQNSPGPGGGTKDPEKNDKQQDGPKFVEFDDMDVTEAFNSTSSQVQNYVTNSVSSISALAALSSKDLTAPVKDGQNPLSQMSNIPDAKREALQKAAADKEAAKTTSETAKATVETEKGKLSQEKQAKADEMTTAIEDQQAKTEAYSNAVETVNDLTTQVAVADSQIRTYDITIGQIENSIADLKGQIQDVPSGESVSDTDKAKIISQNNAIKNQIQELEADKAFQEKEKADLETQKTDLETQLQTAETAKTDAETALTAAQQKVETLKAEFDTEEDKAYLDAVAAYQEASGKYKEACDKYNALKNEIMTEVKDDVVQLNKIQIVKRSPDEASARAALQTYDGVETTDTSISDKDYITQSLQRPVDGSTEEDKKLDEKENEKLAALDYTTLVGKDTKVEVKEEVTEENAKMIVLQDEVSRLVNGELSESEVSAEAKEIYEKYKKLDEDDKKFIEEMYGSVGRYMSFVVAAGDKTATETGAGKDVKMRDALLDPANIKKLAADFEACVTRDAEGNIIDKDDAKIVELITKSQKLESSEQIAAYLVFSSYGGGYSKLLLAVLQEQYIPTDEAELTDEKKEEILKKSQNDALLLLSGSPTFGLTEEKIIEEAKEYGEEVYKTVDKGRKDVVEYANRAQNNDKQLADIVTASDKYSVKEEGKKQDTCIYYVRAALKEVGIEITVELSDEVEKHFIDNGCTVVNAAGSGKKADAEAMKNVKPGMIFSYGEKRHMGIIVSVDYENGTFVTRDGGSGVEDNVRKLSELSDFYIFDPSKLDD